MGKNKLRKFAEMLDFENVYQCPAKEAEETHPVRQLRGHWHEQVFHNQHPIVLELGCGKGEYTVGLARLFPDKNFIGVDIKGARMYTGAKMAIEENLKNVAFLRTNIEEISLFFAENEVDEIWITFPDPQMKKATKRLTSSYFLHRYEKLLKSGGIIHLKTDSPFLYQYTSALVHLNEYKIVLETDDLYQYIAKSQTLEITQVPNLQTHYERQWLSRGLTIKYLQFHLTPKQVIREPEIEIEKDTYRSYGRGEIQKENSSV